MQTFLPFADFSRAAAALDDRRLRSQINECQVVLRACLAEPRSPCKRCDGRGFIATPPCRGGPLCEHCDAAGHVPTPWYNHPIVVMWRGFEDALRHFTSACWVEHRERFNSSPLLPFHPYTGWDCERLSPPWLGDERIHARYRANLMWKWAAARGYPEVPWDLRLPNGDNAPVWLDVEPNEARLYAKPLAPDWSTGYELWEYRTGEKPRRVT